MQTSIINKFPNADICICIVWIKKLPGDSQLTAKKAAEMFTEDRVRHFYDPIKSSGKAIAKRLGWTEQIAWDIYMFYEAGVEWVKTPPQPAYWMHQLTDSWADREHYRTGDDLVNELSVTMERLL